MPSPDFHIASDAGGIAAIEVHEALDLFSPVAHGARRLGYLGPRPRVSIHARCPWVSASLKREP